MTSQAVTPSAATTASAPIAGHALVVEVSAAGCAAMVGAAGDDVRVTEAAAEEAAVDDACRGAVEDAWRRSGVAVDRAAFERVAAGLRTGVPVDAGAVGAAVRVALRGRWTGAAAVVRGDGRAPARGRRCRGRRCGGRRARGVRRRGRRVRRGVRVEVTAQRGVGARREAAARCPARHVGPALDRAGLRPVGRAARTGIAPAAVSAGVPVGPVVRVVGAGGADVVDLDARSRCTAGCPAARRGAAEAPPGRYRPPWRSRPRPGRCRNAPRRRRAAAAATAGVAAVTVPTASTASAPASASGRLILAPLAAAAGSPRCGRNERWSTG